MTGLEINQVVWRWRDLLDEVILIRRLVILEPVAASAYDTSVRGNEVASQIEPGTDV